MLTQYTWGYNAVTYQPNVWLPDQLPLSSRLNLNSLTKLIKHFIYEFIDGPNRENRQTYISLQYLQVAIEGSVMQSGASATVGNVDTAEQGYDDLSALYRIVGCGNMQWGLPVLVTCIDVSRVVEQDSNYFLQDNRVEVVISLDLCDKPIDITTTISQFKNSYATPNKNIR